MISFVTKFLCVFYLTVDVNTRSLSKSLDNYDKFDDVYKSKRFNDPNEQNNRHNDKREARERYNNDMRILSNVTEEVTHLKQHYGPEKYRTLIPKLDKIIYEYNTPIATKKTTAALTTEDDYFGTVQIEALLNDIKARAIEMVAEQNPAVTDIISNTVTEATFEADPILTHLSSPGYALTTFVFLNNMENIDKRTADDSKVILISNTEDKHNVSVRSIKEDAYTIAQSVEDKLQKELKSVYRKVKNRVSKDFHKEVQQAKSTFKCESSKVINKITKGLTKTSHRTTPHRPNTKARRSRGGKTSKKKMKKTTKKHETTTSTPTVDDFAMLTLYEQILAKTHEDNVMKMLTTNKKRNMDDIFRFSKRNPETLTDLSLKEDIQKFYDDGESMPDTDYNNDVIINETNDSSDTTTNLATFESTEVMQTTESAPLEDTSYEGLSDKIAFKDYVNGYKSYLKFQKDQAKDNFSNLVKYQAHKHHKVDDIGKFILNKIPQIPQGRNKRYFIYDSDMDEDISTKTDDSWFKKHFYMFIDNAPPKKYHTSETVSFKTVKDHAGYTSDYLERPALKFSTSGDTNEKEPAEINLDELSKVLEDCKCKVTAHDQSLNADKNIDNTAESDGNNVEESGIAFKVYAPHIISKLFSKGQKYLTKPNENENNFESNNDYEFLFDFDSDRSKRNAKNQVSSANKLTTLLSKKDVTKNGKTKVTNNKKDGYVSIVTQPTAVVNLHKTNMKHSKIKKLLSKLHFHKRNKKKLKEKRHCTRVQRFNPLKKLKDMFKVKTGERVLAPDNVQDYDMMTSHIDTFKVVKYDKIPSIDELKNQVPNISGDFLTNEPEMVSDAPKPGKEWTVNDDINKNDKILSEGDMDFNTVTKNYPVLSSFGPKPVLQRKQTKSRYNTQKMQTNAILKENPATSDDVMDVQVKTLQKIDNNNMFTLSSVTLEDIRKEINKMQLKLYTKDNFKEFYKTTPKYSIQKSYGDLLSNYKENDDMTIKAKLTRIAKYPRSNLKPANDVTESNHLVDNSKLDEFADDANSDQSMYKSYPYSVAEKIHQNYNEYNIDRNKLKPASPLIEGTLRNLGNFREPMKGVKNTDDIVKFKTYPDYFNDLVIWNSDILNYNKDTNPTWQDILRNIEHGVEFTTPSLRDMQKELIEINDHLVDKYFENGQKSLTKLSSNLANSKQQYVVNKDGMKAAVDNNAMKNSSLDNFEDPRNQLRKYPSMESQELIDVLNKLYTVNPNRQMGAKTARAIAKNTRKSSINNKKLGYPKAKNNIHPKQYYNTPLPMKNESFEKFLKENQIDVDSVTTPMIEMPKITKSWLSISNPLPKTETKNEKVNTDLTSAKDKTFKGPLEAFTTLGYRNDFEDDASNPENQIDYLNDLEQDLFNEDDNVNIRLKRSSAKDYETFTDDALIIGKDKYEKFKNKMNNLFDKKQEITTENFNPSSNPGNEVEITIINFDEFDKKGNEILASNNLQTLFKDTTVKVDKTLSDKDAAAKEKALVKIQNENKDMKHDRNLQITGGNESTAQRDATISSLLDERMNDEVTTTNFHQNPNKLRQKYKDTHGNLPKRVQISSNSYKYDVLYNVPDKKSAENEATDFTTPSYSSYNPIKYNGRSSWKESDNSEIDQIMKVIEVVNAVDNFTRPPTSIHIDLPTYYAPSNDTFKLLPINAKISWTDLALKYISGIALIEMLIKLGVLQGNFTDSLNLDFDRNKVFSDGGGVAADGKSRPARAVKTTKKRYTFSQTIHFTREMKRQREKRLFKLLPILQQNIKHLSKNRSTASTLIATTAKKLKTTPITTIDNTMTLLPDTTKSTKRQKTTSKKSSKEKILDKFKLNTDFEENMKASDAISKKIFFSLTTGSANKVRGKVRPIDKEGVYVEEGVYDDGIIYYEAGSKPHKSVTKTKNATPIVNTEENSKTGDNIDTTNCKLKRDVNYETFTAKDVAALEVVVDLIKNTANCDEKGNSHNIFLSKHLTKPSKNTKDNISHVTNSIQVHIAIPYDVPDKKRSLEPLKIRKVFTARLSTPVDLEYQIHSVEEDAESTTQLDSDYGLSPGMYLLVDNANKGGLVLKPIKGTLKNKEDDTKKAENPKESDQVTLSKEFVAAVNKHLMQLYENITAANDNELKSKRDKVENSSKKHNVRRRETNWNRLRNFFGHERVCNCKCKANRTMCRACAASDEVIRELSFEFDNLAKYMSDHCTEIQTFFWMNPKGGKVLRDTVHKIDKSLNDYFKRVRGKCKGRTCETFATYIDKRDFQRSKITKTYIGEPLTDDIKLLSEDFDISTYFIPYNEALKQKGDELVKVINSCIDPNPTSKRSVHSKRNPRLTKNVYSLDNIKVNIICNPDSSSDSSDTSSNFSEPPLTESDNIILDDDLKRNSKRKKIKNKLGRLFTYYVEPVTVKADFKKREATDLQIESPLIADTGGSFWHDYINKGNAEVSNESKPQVEISVVQTKNQKTPVTTSIKATESFKEKLLNMCTRKVNKDNRSLLETTTIDSLSYNMNELFKLLGTVKVVEEARSVTDPTIVTDRDYTKQHKTKKLKTKKYKIHKSTKAMFKHEKPKFFKHKTKTTNIITDVPTNNAYNSSTKTVTNSTLKTTNPKATITNPFALEEVAMKEIAKETLKTESTTTKKNLFKKIKMATLGFLSNIGKGNCVFDLKTTGVTNIDRSIRTASDNSNKNDKIINNIISKATTKTNPTILIMNENSAKTKRESEENKYRGVLLSLINYESEKLDKEKKSIDEENNKEIYKDVLEVEAFERVDDIEHSLADFKVQPTTSTQSNAEVDIDYDVVRGLKNLKTLDLELPAPPGLKTQVGALEKIAHKIGIQMMPDKVATSPRVKTSNRQNSGKTMTLTSSSTRSIDSKEADAIKTSADTNEIKNGVSHVRLRKNKEHNKKNDLTQTDGENYSRNSADKNDKINFRRKNKQRKTNNFFGFTKTEFSEVDKNYKSNEKVEKTTKKRRYNAFDSYIRGNNGIYRLKRNQIVRNNFQNRFDEEYCERNVKNIKGSWIKDRLLTGN